ncbi:MAG TPA: helical backbone metal receptor [Prolixibacteraceae bacterium]|nr:helical backbone metal receptor [Prolixibacteraceae bacterium]HPR61011.1 helical backbone metal receptor [Prolixibacteraceae bacterium]
MQFSKIYLLVVVLFAQLALFGQNEKRIVSLAPSITKNIYFLDAQNQLVGCTSYCTEALNDNVEVIASAVKVNIEKTVSLLPDLVLATTITDPETIDMFKKFGVKVAVFPTPQSFNEICDQFLLLGSLLGKEENAKKIVDESKAKIEHFSAKNELQNSSKIFFQIGAKPLFTVLPNTFMNDYISFVGSKNIAEGMSQGTITRESVLSHNPDVIFVVTMGIIGDEEKQTWESYKGLKAADNNKVFIIDAEKACSPTPVTFVETLETIYSLINQKQK